MIRVLSGPSGLPLPMPWSLSTRVFWILSWFRDYDRIQSLAVLLIYVQIGCSLIGSLGALYNGLLLVNLAVSLFALVAVESNSQTLGRTYGVLLACTILLDIVWFILFFSVIWEMSSDESGTLFVFSVKLTLWMQLFGFSVRSLSSILWIQMYRLGISLMGDTSYREADNDVRCSFINPPVHETSRQVLNTSESLGGSIYDIAYYSSLFQDVGGETLLHEDIKNVVSDGGGSTSQTQASSQITTQVMRQQIFPS